MRLKISKMTIFSIFSIALFCSAILFGVYSAKNTNVASSGSIEYKYDFTKDYQQVEYIEFTGTQCIELDVIATADTYIVMDLAISSVENTGAIFNGGSADMNRMFDGGVTVDGSGNPAIYVEYGMQWSGPVLIPGLNKKFNFVFAESTIEIDGEIKHTMSYPNNGAGGSKLTIGSKTNSFIGKIYSCQVYDAKSLDLVPCYRKADGVAGMWDKVNEKFYPNSGTGFDFVTGPYVEPNYNVTEPIVLPQVFKQVEYIEFNGTQYIDTGINLTSYNIVEMAVEFTSITTDGYILGSSGGKYFDLHATSDVLYYEYSGEYWMGTAGGKISNNVKYDVSFCAEEGMSIVGDVSKTYDRTGYPNWEKLGASLLLGRSYYSASAYGSLSGKVYSFTIIEGTGTQKVINKFIPCYRSSDGVAGFYDVVDGKFHVNALTTNTTALGCGKFTSTTSDFAKNYQQVEYIESTGEQYIDTGIKPTQNTGFSITYSTTNTFGTSGYGTVLGAREGSSVKELNVSTYPTTSSVNTGTIRFGSSSIDAGLVANQKMSINLINKVYTNASGTKHTFTNSFSTPVNLTIFALNNNGSMTYFAKSKLYSLKLYDQSNLIRDYIPCYRKSDGSIGLYDIVNNVFYENANASGSGFITSDNMILDNKYQQVNYIEATGTQYINTGIVPNQNTGFDLVYLTKNGISADNVDYGSIMGARLGSASNEYQVTTYCVDSTTTGVFRFGNATLNAGLVANKKMSLSVRNKTYSNGSNVTKSLSGTFTSPVTLTVFALNNNGTITQYGKGQLYKLVIYNGTTIVRNFIPCYEKSTGEVGLYDIVNKKFYKNAGTGKFSAGGAVINSAYQSVEYIQSSGTQYIDTGFKANQNTAVKMLATSTSTANQAFFSSRTALSSNTFSCFIVSAKVRHDYGTQQISTSVTATANLTYDIYANKNILTVNGVSDTISKANFQSTGNLYIGTSYNNGFANYFLGKIYYVRVWDNGTLVRDLVPCYRTSDNVIGMYDLVNGRFYTNAGSGTFTKGANN